MKTFIKLLPFPGNFCCSIIYIWAAPLQACPSIQTHSLASVGKSELWRRKITLTFNDVSAAQSTERTHHIRRMKADRSLIVDMKKKLGKNQTGHCYNWFSENVEDLWHGDVSLAPGLQSDQGSEEEFWTKPESEWGAWSLATLLYALLTMACCTVYFIPSKNTLKLYCLSHR